MNHSILFQSFFAVALTALISLPAGTAQAGGGNCDLQLGVCGKAAKCCPNCKHCCNLTAEVVDASKSCFEVEEKVICIPRVVFPWQRPGNNGIFGLFGHHRSACDACDGCDGAGCVQCSNCVHNGATTRTVKILKTKKYTCPECEYSWSPEKVACAPGGCCGTAGTCCDAASNCCDAIPSGSVPAESVPNPIPDAAPESASLQGMPLFLPVRIPSLN